jgi:hypothetical protein
MIIEVKQIMHIVKIFITLATMGLFGGSCTKDTGKNGALTIEDMLVKNNEITGWVYSGSGWIANNGSELTRQIDGGAELYIKYGFIEAASQLYQGIINDVSCEIVLTIYNLGTSENVIALFDDPDLGLSSALTWTDNPAGTLAKYIRYSGVSQVLCLYRDHYLVYLSMSFDTEESLNILKQFGYNVDEKIKQVIE